MPNRAQTRQLHSSALLALLLSLSPGEAQGQGFSESDLPLRRVASVCASMLTPLPNRSSRLVYGTDLLQSGFGLYASTFGGGGDGPSSSVGGRGMAVAYSNARLASFRGTQMSSLGGGRTGFDGQLALDYSAGFVKRFGVNHGVVARAGAELYLLGNSHHFRSGIELPNVNAGYQWFSHRWLLEVAGRASVTLIGRYRTAQVRHRTGAAPTVGAHVGAFFPWASYQGQARLLAGGSAQGTREYIGLLCGVLRPISVCAEHRYAWSDASTTPSAYIGLSVLRSIRRIR